MTVTLLTPPHEMIHLSGISWQTYETLLEELSDRRLRLTIIIWHYYYFLTLPSSLINKF